MENWHVRSIRLNEAKDCKNLRMMGGQWYMIYQSREMIIWTGKGGGSGWEHSDSRIKVDWVPVKWVLLELGRMLNDPV